MFRPRLTPRAGRLFAIAALLAGVMAGFSAAAPGSVAAYGSRAGLAGPAASLTIRGSFSGVAATSARNAWAVGALDTTGDPLIARWNGTTWKQVPGPRPAAGGFFTGVAATSARNAWAVGDNFNGKTLIARWNGTTWKQVPSPNTAAGGVLAGVAATSARNAWAVGSANTKDLTLIAHWNGTRWKRVPSPDLATGGVLSAVAATSIASAWAVGFVFVGRGPRTHALIERWNGTAWKRVPSPSPRAGGFLNGVIATSARNAWAVGGRFGGGALIERWNGAAWKQVPSPNLPRGGFLSDVAATSARNAWAVGFVFAGTGFETKTLIEHWNGTAWKRVPSPGTASNSSLNGVAATSARNAWAVGSGGVGGNTLIVRWNGTTWK